MKILNIIAISALLLTIGFVPTNIPTGEDNGNNGITTYEYEFPPFFC